MENILEDRERLLKDQKWILLEYGFKKNDTVRYNDLSEIKAEELSNKIKKSNDKIKAMESKERVIRLLMAKSGLYRKIKDK